jgi:uncharacterized protein (DUF2237 family)
LVEALGVHATAAEVSPEFVARQWALINDFSGARPFDSATAALTGAFGDRP